MKKLYMLCILLLLSVAFVGCGSDETSDDQTTVDNSDILNVEDVLTDTINFTKWENFDYEDYSYAFMTDSTDNYNITEAGVYVLSGFLTETITVNVLDTDDVYLVLNNVNINTGVNQAIYVESAEDVIINVCEGTDNYIIDSNNYDEVNADMNAVVYSDTDLVINGTGNLTVTANYNDAIQSKDGFMYFDGCTLSIDSGDDSIQSTNYVIFIDGIFNIDSDDKGVISDGSIYIYGGTFTMDTQDDSFSAAIDFEVYGGNIDSNTSEVA